MLDLERRVSESLTRIRDSHTESYRGELPRLRGEIVRRTKRRRRSVAGLAAATLQKGDAKAAEDAIAQLEKAYPSSQDLPNFKQKLAGLKK